MANRYMSRRLLKNDLEMYSSFFRERGVNFISQYNTAIFDYPWPEEIATLTTVQHIWKAGDRLYKLSSKYYGSPTYWWVIGFFNQLPTEAHIKLGDVIDIPLPLETILSYI